VTERVRYRSLMHDSARWEHFRLRAGDVVVSTPPKAGTTWTQTICLMLVHGTTDLGAPVSVLSPWLDQQVEAIDTVVAALDAQDGRRVIKTHTPLDGLPREPGVSYVCVGRDPRAMARSMVDHQANLDMDRVLVLRARAVGNHDLADFGPTPGPPPDPEVRLREWVRDNPPYSLSSLQRCLHHWRTFWDAVDDPSIGMFHYVDLRDDRPAEVGRIAALLGLPPDPDRDRAVADAVAFPRMRAQAAAFAPNAVVGMWHDDAAFFRAGRGGEPFDPALEADYEAIVAAQVPPALAAWVHGGRGARPA
jgi:hypothetical protein